jgi:predicted 3-demethylubiquinone-9 3-methyltransferase (glyoxalase superfamily)
MFTGDQHGKAEEAINYYMSVFPGSAVERISKYSEDEEGPTGLVNYAAFSLSGQNFKAMDSGVTVPFRFTPGISFAVNCKSQQEIDFYWDKLTMGGDESFQQCGWLKDKYDVSWQVVPETLKYMLADVDSEQSKRVMKALIPMKKLDMNILKAAYDDREVTEDKEDSWIDFAESHPNYYGNSKDTLTPNEEL